MRRRGKRRRTTSLVTKSVTFVYSAAVSFSSLQDFAAGVVVVVAVVTVVAVAVIAVAAAPASHLIASVIMS